MTPTPPNEFEVFCYLLLLREHPGDDVRYYGQTGDGGRDIVQRVRVGAETRVRLIQCKRYGDNVVRGAVLGEMAKVWANVFDGTIPERPDELVFYAVPDLTNPAKNLIDSQHLWRKERRPRCGHTSNSSDSPTASASTRTSGGPGRRCKGLSA